MKGIHLSLLIGPAVPRPVPTGVIEALTEVQVQSSATGRNGFQLSLTLGKGSKIEQLLLQGYFEPIVTRVIVVLIVNGTPEVLMDGVITQEDVAPANQAGQSTLNITGLDLSALFNLIDLTGVSFPPGIPTFAIVAMLLSKYATIGVIPKVIPSAIEFVRNPLEGEPRQVGTDFEYITSLARKVGYVFYVEPGPAPGLNTAYWGPEIRVGLPQPALNVGMDASTNVESLSFAYDGLAKELPVAFVQPKRTRIPIPVPVPDVSAVKLPLAAVPAIPRRVRQLSDTAKHDFGEAMLLALAGAVRSADAVTGSGQLDVLRYGRLLKPRRLVGVRGAGLPFDGFWYVPNVSTTIKRGSVTQSFSLARDGLISNTPRVFP